MGLVLVDGRNPSNTKEGIGAVTRKGEGTVMWSGSDEEKRREQSRGMENF